MKPRFALNLSPDGIGLFHRNTGRWNLVGEVALDAPDLDDQLKMLRSTASGLESGGVLSALIIPDDQILYTDVSVGTDSEAHPKEVRDGLTGLTPYDVADLVFDYNVEGDTAKVAVVARETLEEAEAFATEHRFNPVAFVAAPDGDVVPRAPWFGTTKAAPDLIPDDETLERDNLPPFAFPEKSEEPPQPEIDTPKPSPAAQAAEDDFDHLLEESVEAEPDAPLQLTPAAPEITPLTPPEVRPTFLTTRSGTPDTVTAAQITTAPRIHMSEPASVTPPSLGAATRNVGVTSSAAPMLEPEYVESPAPEPEPIAPAKTSQKKRKPSAKKGRKAAKASPKVEIKPNITATPIALPPANEADALTVFGARKEQPAPRKSRSLGLMLTVALVALMGAYALWVSLFATEDSVAETNEAVTVAAPQVEAPATLAVPVPQPIETAAPDPEELADAPEVTVEPAPNNTAGPAPTVPIAPTVDGLDDLYIASIDPVIPGEDAVALPPADSLINDAALSPQTLPLGPGVEFQFDGNGRVVPTTEGTLTPSGVVVFAGQPPKVPPARPEAANAPSQPELDAAQIELDRLAAFKPRERPSNLADRLERAETGGGFSRAELAAIRPRARPQSVQEVQEAEAPAEQPVQEQAPLATAGTVPVSPKPLGRPASLAAAAEKARASETTQVAAAVPAKSVIQPRLPSSASVAKQATLENAINLRKLNLIGVYGSSSNRRALVRLSSGRYVKVKVGDKIDGGKVAAIGEDELRYVKNGRNIILEMPKG
ncbi:hypothetical protein [Actibacterium lipolyticum]|uniref:Type IV pilus biogenesis n=1 Tax=Actibacterium lipolyticum TaxID=1524263 RepID=A0A238JSI8_9RHOB|nr:hypothetical protein [Actibacterium lipolyticum]SMX33621.1 Type IV pilus biogenesis [Actibacterium lipolyticum]